MFTTEKEFLAFLAANDFTYQRIEHPAVFTCAEAELHRPEMPVEDPRTAVRSDS